MTQLSIKLMSDLHLELCLSSEGINGEKFEVLSTLLENQENADVLVIAGDLCKAGLLRNFVNNLPFDQYETVVYVPGNHEYWRNTIASANRRMREFASHYPNMRLLIDESCTIGNIAVYGMTYWYNGLSPVDMTMMSSINDYHQIRRANYKRTTPDYFQDISLKSERQFLDWAATWDNILLVTHHPTSRRFRLPHEKDYPGYGSIMNFPRDFDTSRIIAQCHGHTHIRRQYLSEYDIPTHVNAVGYIGFERVNTHPHVFNL